MTISTAAAPLSYAGNDSTTDFAVTWVYILKAHVVATLRDAAGVETVQVLDTDYTLTDPGDTGTLGMTEAPATGETLVITSEPPNTQETDIPLGGSFPARSVEDALDLASQVSQHIQTDNERSLRVPKTDTRSGTQLEIPNETDRASKFLTFDASGDPTVTAVAPTGTALITPFAESYLDDTTQEATLTTLGAASDKPVAGRPKNLGLAFTVGSSALTCNIKTADGSAPTSADKVSVPMRDLDAALSTSTVREIAASLSLVISSGSTLGHFNTVGAPIHWYLIDNAGTLELAASTRFFGMSGIVTTTAEGGAGAADSALVMYSTSARTTVPFQWVGETVDTQTTAGTWAVVPTTATLVREQGAIVQTKDRQSVAMDTGTGLFAADDNIPQNTEGSAMNDFELPFTPKVATNLLRIELIIHVSLSIATDWAVVAIFEDSIADALGVGTDYLETATAIGQITLSFEVSAASTSARTYKVRAGTINAATMTINGTSGARVYGGKLMSSLRVTEIQQ